MRELEGLKEISQGVGLEIIGYGKIENSYVLASETCALDIIGYSFLREVENDFAENVLRQHQLLFKVL